MVPSTQFLVPQCSDDGVWELDTTETVSLMNANRRILIWELGTGN